MIADKLTTFCDAVELNTGAAGAYMIGDVIDIEDLRDIGQHSGLYLVIHGGHGDKRRVCYRKVRSGV